MGGYAGSQNPIMQALQARMQNAPQGGPMPMGGQPMMQPHPMMMGGAAPPPMPPQANPMGQLAGGAGPMGLQQLMQMIKARQAAPNPAAMGMGAAATDAGSQAMGGSQAGGLAGILGLLGIGG